MDCHEAMPLAMTRWRIRHRKECNTKQSTLIYLKDSAASQESETNEAIHNL